MSDLHLEFEEKTTNFSPAPTEFDKETVLILAGDIGVALKAEPFLQAMCKRFYKVVYVLGNHEYYHHDYFKVRVQWNEYPAMPGNFILLDDHSAIIDDQYRFIGGTLWTDFNNGDWFAYQQARQGMNDFNIVTKQIRNDEGDERTVRFDPTDAHQIHQRTRDFIVEELEKPFEGKTIVVTHHLPHPLCVPKRYKTSGLNAAYMTNLDWLIEKYDIDLWCHGHTHDNVDVEVHGTRILCNPRGYTPDALNENFNEELIFEL